MCYAYYHKCVSTASGFNYKYVIELIPKIPFQNMHRNVKRERDFDGHPCQ